MDRIRRIRTLALIASLVVVSLVAACAGEEGPRGPAGEEGPTGSPGPQGPAGTAGVPTFVWKDPSGTVQNILFANNNTFWMDANGIIWHLSHTEGTFIDDALAFYFASADCTGPAYAPVFMLARQGMRAPDGTYRAMIDAPSFVTGFNFQSFIVPAGTCQVVGGTISGAAVHSSSMDVVTQPTPLPTPLHPELVVP